MPPPRLIIATSEFAPIHGGIATYVSELATAIAALPDGPETEVWAPSGGRDPGISGPFTFALRRLPVSHRTGLRARWQLRRTWRHRADDLAGCWLHLAEPGPLLAWLECPEKHLPAASRVLVTLHGSEIARIGASRIWRERFRSRLHRIARIIVLSRFNRERLLEWLPEAEPRLAIVPGAVRTGLLRLADEAHAGRSAGEASAEGSPFRLVCHGRIHPRKGQLALVHALGSHLEENDRKRLTLALAGPVRRSGYFRRLIRLARAYGLRLEYSGEPEERHLADLLASGDAAAVPSQPTGQSVEGFGLAALEAMAFGLPVVASRLGGLPEVVTHGEDGILVPAGDSRALAAAVAGLIHDPVNRRNLGEAAARRARAFSWTEAARQTVELLRTSHAGGLR